jgi:hypothetical protein
MVAADDKAYALKGGRLLPWSFRGYGGAWDSSELKLDMRLLTPPTTVEVLKQGYKPVWHPSS